MCHEMNILFFIVRMYLTHNSNKSSNYKKKIHKYLYLKKQIKKMKIIKISES